MDRQEILKGKLNDIDKYMSTLDTQDKDVQEYMENYRARLHRLILGIDQHTLCSSKGTAILGLMRGLSECDVLCADKKLFKMAHDADVYYCDECVEW